MTQTQRIWARARDELEEAVTALGYPAELAGLLAKQLRSPRAIERMTSWLYQAHPRSMEMIADEMLAICADTEAWREKAESREAQANYSAWLSSRARMEMQEDSE